MSFFATTLSIILLSLSLLTSARELIANLNYGDTRPDVTYKLKNSKLLESDIPDNLFGRVGINGSFTTTRNLAGMKYSLYFDWSDSSKLKQVTFRSDALPRGAYDRGLKATWKHAINFLSSMYGPISNAGDYPQQSKVTVGVIQYSHEWATNNGFIYLGVGQDTKGYNLVITFSEDSLKTQ